MLKKLFPYTCILCHAVSGQQMDLCLSCQRELPFYQGNYLYNDIFAMCDYVAPITKLILELKFQQQLVNARVLGELMAKKIKQREKQLPQCIIPVPLSNKRLRERGFNQAIEIAKPISKILNVPMDISSCKRVRHTKAQAEISAKQRQKNIKNAFAVSRKFSAKHVVVLDDVVTTGQTVKEFSRVLREAGAETIEIWCVAKTI
ncbi:MAG: phosphoribosyltransferase family protein [Gammaproteobacteria bacterium]|jgi:ComF family protein